MRGLNVFAWNASCMGPRSQGQFLTWLRGEKADLALIQEWQVSSLQQAYSRGGYKIFTSGSRGFKTKAILVRDFLWSDDASWCFNDRCLAVSLTLFSEKVSLV